MEFIYQYGVIPTSLSFPRAGLATLFDLPFLHGGWFHLLGTCFTSGFLAITWRTAWGMPLFSFYLLAGSAEVSPIIANPDSQCQP